MYQTSIFSFISVQESIVSAVKMYENDIKNHSRSVKMDTLSSYLWILSVILLSEFCDANYRHFYIENTDICKENSSRKTNELNIGTGAMILQLGNPLKIQQHYHNKIKRCEIHLKAPPHFGIMVYVEEMNLRKSSKDGTCVDFVQFGQEDIIPFITLYKSERICGESGALKGEKFDVPSGSLLIWVNLSGRRKTSYWPEISVANLTLVVTPYQADCGSRAPPASHGFMKCGDMKKCIYQKYRCDRHFNCATDNTTVPADELDCVYESESDLPGGNSTLFGDSDRPGDGLPPLNWISWALIIVSCCLMFFLFMVLCLRFHKQNRWPKMCCCCKKSTSESCEFPEQAVIHSLAEISTHRHLHPTEQNIYIPLRSYINQPVRDEAALLENHQQIQHEYAFADVEPVSDFPEEPPPAYFELFPHSVNLTTVEREPREVDSETVNETGSSPNPT